MYCQYMFLNLLPEIQQRGSNTIPLPPSMFACAHAEEQKEEKWNVPHKISCIFYSCQVMWDFKTQDFQWEKKIQERNKQYYSQ